MLVILIATVLKLPNKCKKSSEKPENFAYLPISSRIAKFTYISITYKENPKQKGKLSKKMLAIYHQTSILIR